MTDGTDVSGHQRGLNWWEAQRTPLQFAYVKTSEGVGWRDPAAEEHVIGVRDAGMIVGGYHYARPDTNAPEADAETFAESLINLGLAQPGVLPPCLDMEQNAGVNMISWTQRCAARVREITGYNPIMIYANTSWWLNQLGGGGWLDDGMYGWTAHYGRAKGEPGFSSPKTVMHQYTDAMAIRGYAGLVDGNYCWADLSLLTQGGDVIAPPVVDPRPDGWWTVDRGQTLSGIGVSVGIDWRTLAEWNDLANPNLLSVGQRLRLTPPEAGSGGGNGGTHTVAAGETLSGIAAEHGLTWQELYAANRGIIADPDRIQPGWVLLVPAPGSEPAPPSSDHLYVVRTGDTLSSIGASLGVSWQWLAETNGIANPNLIYAEQQLRY